MSLLQRILLVLSLLAFARVAEAQVIRGTVEDSTGMPLDNVTVSLIPAASDSILRSTRTGNAGEFSLPVPRAGRYRVRLNRIGFTQQTSDVIEVRATELITLKFRMVAAVQQLSSVVIVDRRNVTLNELMSASGFDLRRNRYPMNSMDADRLADEGGVSLLTIFEMRTFNAVEVVSDTQGTSLRMTQVNRTDGARGYCFPEVHLDGTLMSDGDPRTAESALMMFTGITANQTYGIEVYREREIPPPGLGGMFGVSGNTMRPCGVVAVWTKAGRERAMIRERTKAEGSIQVVRGRVVDFATGHPVAGVTVRLKSEFGADLEQPVITDSSGVFAIQTKQAERLRLSTFGGTHVPVTTPPFPVDLEEMVSVEIIVARDKVPLATLALMGRELARNYTATNTAGFSFRRRRGLGGVYLDSLQVARSGAQSFFSLLGGIPALITEGAGENATLLLRRPMTQPPEPATRGSSRGTVAPPLTPVGQPATCTPMYFLNGELQREPRERVFNLPLPTIYGIEVYAAASDVPHVYRLGSTGCGMIGVWTRTN